MPTPPSSSSAWQARQALGARLGELRQDAGLSGRVLAHLCGWHESKVSRIEHARTAPSADDIRAWCEHCGQPAEAEDLIAFLHTVEGMFIEWRRMERTGLRRAQEAVLPLWERTRLFRAYSSWLIPGAVQTSAYTTAVVRAIAARRELPDDVEDAVAVRADRLRLLREGDHRFLVLIEESVLRNVIGGPEAMAGQLGHLITVASLPSVSVGIIPMGLDRDAVWPVEDFWIFDDRQVNVELVSGWLALTQLREIAMYAKTFSELAEIAVRGAQARALITAAINALGLNRHANTCKFVYPYPVCGVSYLYRRLVRDERHVTWDGRLHTTLAGGQRQAVADEVPREQARGSEEGTRRGRGLAASIRREQLNSLSRTWAASSTAITVLCCVPCCSPSTRTRRRSRPACRQ